MRLRLGVLLRLVGWSVGVLLLAVSAPIGETLWAEVLSVSGSAGIALLSSTPPPSGGDGCTPGFWKQEQHFSSWPEPYTPVGSLAEAFEIPPLGGGPTLLDGLEAKGGGLDALLRHAVAALLNAASGDIEYALAVVEVVSMFQSALRTGEFEATKDLFEAANEGTCPLPLKADASDEAVGIESGTLLPETTPTLTMTPLSTEASPTVVASPSVDPSLLAAPVEPTQTPAPAEPTETTVP